MQRLDWVLGAAALAMGLLAGFFYAYAISVMPGLAGADDRTFVVAMRGMIEAVNESPLFFLTLLGAPALTGWALVAERRAGASVRWLGAALVLYGISVLLTGAIHIPLNDDLVQAGDPADPAAVVEDFEATWVAWHIVRTVALLGAFAALVAALVVHARGNKPRGG